MFSVLPKANFNFWFAFKLSSANAFNLDLSKILLSGKELTHNMILDKSKISLNPYPNTPFWDGPKFKEAADDNWNMAIKGF